MSSTINVDHSQNLRGLEYWGLQLTTGPTFEGSEASLTRQAAASTAQPEALTDAQDGEDTEESSETESSGHPSTDQEEELAAEILHALRRRASLSPSPKQDPSVSHDVPSPSAQMADYATMMAAAAAVSPTSQQHSPILSVPLHKRHMAMIPDAFAAAYTMASRPFLVPREKRLSALGRFSGDAAGATTHDLRSSYALQHHRNPGIQGVWRSISAPIPFAAAWPSSGVAMAPGAKLYCGGGGPGVAVTMPMPHNTATPFSAMTPGGASAPTSSPPSKLRAHAKSPRKGGPSKGSVAGSDGGAAASALASSSSSSATATTTSKLPQSRAARSRVESHQCPNCLTSDSPLWRNCLIRGKVLHLCNSCGLRYKKQKYCPYCYVVYYDAETNTDNWCQCENCRNWTHIKCVTEAGDQVVDPYLCLKCQKQQPDS